MTLPPSHSDLVARALGECCANECARVDLALASDPALRAQFEEIAAHLLRYDHLLPAPPAPAFAALEAALDVTTRPGTRPGVSAGEAAGVQPEMDGDLKARPSRAPLEEPRIPARVASFEQPAPNLKVLDLQTRSPGKRQRLRWGALAAVAALVTLALWSPALWSAWRSRGNDGLPEGNARFAGGLTLVPGPGLELIRAGRPLPAPARALRDLRPGDELHCHAPAEAHLAGRVRVVLDGGASLRIEQGTASSSSQLDAVLLAKGRAWFEVAPGAFQVHTPYGTVRVLGTAFEVDLRAGRLEVSVAHGRVAAETSQAAPHQVSRSPRSVEIPAGWGLSSGRLKRLAGPAGAWFRRPHLTLAHAAAPPAAPLARGTPLRLELRFANAGQVPVRLRGPGAVRTAVWISFETSGGRTVAEMPVLPANVVAGQALLEPGASADLGPGQERVLTIQILPPLGSPGAYRCRALYRPEGQPAVLSEPLDLEVR